MDTTLDQQQADEMLEMLYLRGDVGFVHPQLANATYQRSAEVAEVRISG